MRVRIVALAVLGALVAVGLASAMTAKLSGAITSGGSISLKSKGKVVRTLKVGKYTFTVKDTASIHNFTLDGPGINDKTITGTGFTGTKTVTIKLAKKGTYKVYCTIHPYIKQTFRVS